MKRSALLILAVTLFIDLLGFGLIVPLIPVYITHYGGTPAIGGYLLACFSAMQFVFAPIWGRISDRRGRRPMILLSLFGSAVSYFFFGAAGSLTVLFIARVASGVLTAASMPTAQAYVADVTPPDKRAGGMAVLGAAFGLGFALGPAVGGFLSQYSVLGCAPLATPAFFAAGLALCNFVWAFVMLPETHTDHVLSGGRGTALDAFPAIARAMRSPAVGAQLLVFAFATFSFAGVESSFSWLVLLRFSRGALTQMAARNWSHLARLPLARVPLEVRRLLPGLADWHAYAGSPFTAIPPPLRRQLIEQAQTQATSVIFLIVGVMMIISQVAVMRGLARRTGEHRLVMFGTLLLALTLVGLAVAPALWQVAVLSAGLAIGMGLMSPSLNALITHAAGPQERGTLSGAQQGLGSLARIIGPPINNSLIAVRTAIPFVSSAVLMLVAFALSLRLRPLPRAEDAGRELHANRDVPATLEVLSGDALRDENPASSAQTPVS